jgi:DNA modification methylase
MKRTIVYKGNAAYSRSSHLILEDDMVEFDCSDEEYGPIRFPLQTLLDAIKLHTKEEDI